MTGMSIPVNFSDIGHRFVGLVQQIFVPRSFVHQALLEVMEVEMSHVASVPVIDGDVEPEVDQGHLKETPQIPRRVYHAVMLPQSTQRLLERLVVGQADMVARWTQQFQRMDRQMDQMEDLIEWVMASEAERRTQAGLAVQPPPRPQVYPGTDMEAGPSARQIHMTGGGDDSDDTDDDMEL
ncbi:hypothetical protein Hdeb2414_s0004g00140171 [Helianthus debilis subsp. tardiflorus]